MPFATADEPRTRTAILDAAGFCRSNFGIVLLLSALILVPLFWHRHIEAGDLASHTYNGWLAGLAERGQAPGVYLATQWNNVLFDISISRLGNYVGLLVAEKIIVSAAVLIFFWGVFSFLSVVTGDPPWLFTPCIAMLAYGYAFSMGFINYYFSIGLACWTLAILWANVLPTDGLSSKGQSPTAQLRNGVARNWIYALPLAILTLIAHPIGFLWLISTIAYVLIRRNIPARLRIAVPAAAVAALTGLHFYIAHHASFRSSWKQDAFYLRNGSDQLIFYGHRYVMLAYAAVAWGILCFVVDRFPRKQDDAAPRASRRKSLPLTLELYVVALCVTALMPENLHTSFYASWVGLLVSRLTLVSAILGLTVLNSGLGRTWFVAGFAACAAVFFVFLFQDTGNLDRLEENADQVVATLPIGTRVVPVVNAPSGWRAAFIFHEVERACIGRCFSYSNYEPSSLEFRVRVAPGSSIVTSSADVAESAATGDYVVRDSDPPLTAIYQCDDGDFTKLCAARLRVGETVETPIVENGDQ